MIGRGGHVAIPLAVAFAIGAGACSSKDVVVATLDPLDASPPHDAAAGQGFDAGPEGGPPPAKPCQTNFDCPSNAFCSKTSCDAPTGGCAPRPLDCDATSAHVCGCDQVMYWNDCLRKQAGTPFSTSEDTCQTVQCASPDGSDCPVFGASCARIVPEGVPCMNLVGYCWKLPDQCPTPGSGPPPKSYVECMGGPGSPCRPLCDAIRTGIPHHGVPGVCQ